MNMITFKPGDIFLTRWFNETKNTSPGYWNHCAIMNHNGFIIEALADQGVVKQDFDKWFSSLEVYCVLRHIDTKIASGASICCNNYIGKPYRLITSTFSIIGKRRINLGLNCVSLVRLAYRDSSGIDYRISFPDDFLNKEVFRGIYGNESNEG